MLLSSIFSSDPPCLINKPMSFKLHSPSIFTDLKMLLQSHRRHYTTKCTTCPLMKFEWNGTVKVIKPGTWDAE